MSLRVTRVRFTPAPDELRATGLGFVLRSIKATRVRDLKATELMAYRGAQLSLGKSHRTVNCHVNALKALTAWALRSGLIAEDPIRHFAPLPYTEQHMRHIRRALTDSEIEALLAAVHADDEEQAAHVAAERSIGGGSKGVEWESKRRTERVPQLPLFTVLLEVGSRWWETVSVTWEDLDRRQAAMRLRASTTKSGRTRIVPLRRELIEEIWALREVHARARQRMVQPTDRVFLSPEGADWKRETNNPRRLLDRYLERAGIPKQTAEGLIDLHALRHSAASRMARNGVPLVIAARVLGHASIEVTSRHYVHTTTEDLRQAVVEAVGKARRA